MQAKTQVRDLWSLQAKAGRSGTVHKLHSHTLLPPPSPMRPLLARRGL